MLLAETLDLRDAGTARHSRTVGEYARRTAIALGLPADKVERIHAAGVLHDLGKLGVADAILHKPDTLDEAEWKEIARHPEIGARILEHAGMSDIAGWVRAHHERIDGRGYPNGAERGEEIPLEARILAVADAYEAMIAGPPVPRGDAGRRRPRGDPALRRHSVRPDRRGRVPPRSRTCARARATARSSRRPARSSPPTSTAATAARSSSPPRSRSRRSPSGSRRCVPKSTKYTPNRRW